MVWPIVLKNLVVKLGVIVRPRADIDDKVVVFVVLVEIVGDISD